MSETPCLACGRPCHLHTGAGMATCMTQLQHALRDLAGEMQQAATPPDAMPATFRMGNGARYINKGGQRALAQFAQTLATIASKGEDDGHRQRATG